MSKLVLARLDNYGQIVDSVDYFDYEKNGSSEFSAYIHGNSLLNILQRERRINENMQLNFITTDNVHSDVSRILGNIAEALIVEACNQNAEINRELAKIARFGKVGSKYLDNFIAIGTSLERTRTHYFQYYQPNDTQRDIIWVYKENIEQQLTQPNLSGAVAGLQVKASHNWAYVKDSINQYSYPVLYFDLNNDWGDLNYYLSSHKISATLIYPSEIIYYLKDILMGYYHILSGLLNEKFSLKWVMENAYHHNDQVLATGLDMSMPNRLIIPSQKIIMPD